LKLLRGNPGKQRLPANEPQPARPPTCPDPPPHITGYAADEWWQTAPELHRLGLLTRIDVPVLAAYCYSYGQWRTAAETLAKMEANDPVTGGLMIKTKYSDAVQNPLVSLARKHAADMVATHPSSASRRSRVHACSKASTRRRQGQASSTGCCADNFREREP
jgi:P27 family predicted phage terminase small subunit